MTTSSGVGYGERPLLNQLNPRWRPPYETGSIWANPGVIVLPVGFAVAAERAPTEFCKHTLMYSKPAED